MTGALQLLYIWRSPARRIHEPITVLENDHLNTELDARRSLRDCRHGRRGEDGDPSRCSHSNVRHPKTCRSNMNRELLGRSSRRGSGRGYLGPESSSNCGVSNSALTRLGLTREDQLPFAVQEARKRLLERLKCISLTSDTSRRDEPSSPDNGSRLSNSNFNVEYSVGARYPLSFGALNTKKVPSLCWDAFCAANGETSRRPDGGDLPECSICLEGFEDGSRLIKLHCNHKFHPACLQPWVMSSGDCPLCRAQI